MQNVIRPLYFPQSVGRYSLETLVVEQFEPGNWHYYQIEPTRLRPDDHVLDCGAAEGLFSLQAEPLCRRVYAAEPLPFWIQALRKTFAGSPTVEILPFALSDSDRPVRLKPGTLDSSITSGLDGIEVDARTVDSLFVDQNRPVTYLKGDLEGAEVDVLCGAKRTIRTFAPRIAFTTYHQADHAVQIANLLKRINPRYRTLCKGIEYRAGAPVMLHAWID
jgi:FkbM family methyltransferase